MFESMRGRLIPVLVLFVGLAPAACAVPAEAVVPLEVASARGTMLAFEPARLTAPAQTRLELTFRNRSDQPHNLTFGTPLAAASRTIVAPGESDVIELAPPAPGDYRYVCTIHPGMEGLLRIE